MAKPATDNSAATFVARRKVHKIYYFLYFIASALIALGLFMWVRQDQQTNEKTADTNATVAAIDRAVKDLEADHDGQDALLTCLFNILAEQDQVTKVQIEGCVIQTAVPETDRDTAPSAGQSPDIQGGTPPAQTTPVLKTPTSDTPPAQPEKPDNEGIILDLPLLPKINIPSPL